MKTVLYVLPWLLLLASAVPYSAQCVAKWRDEEFNQPFMRQDVPISIPGQRAERRYNEALTSGEKWAVEAEIKKIWGVDSELGLKIATAETGLRCDAVGDGHLAYFKDGVEYGKSYGPFQLRALPGRPPVSALSNCRANIYLAYQWYKEQGPDIWSVCHNEIKCY